MTAGELNHTQGAAHTVAGSHCGASQMVPTELDRLTTPATTPATTLTDSYSEELIIYVHMKPCMP